MLAGTHNAFSLAQIIGYIALAITVYAFAQKHDQRLMTFSVISSFVWALHMWLLGAQTAVAVNLINAVRTTGAKILKRRYQRIAMCLLLLLVYVTFALFTWHGWRDDFALAAGIIACNALYLTTGIQLRLLIMIVDILWFTNNVLVHSIGGIVNEILVFSVNGFTVWRLYREHKSTAALTPETIL